jgi:hypothetical protein
MAPAGKLQAPCLIGLVFSRMRSPHRNIAKEAVCNEIPTSGEGWSLDFP